MSILRIAKSVVFAVATLALVAVPTAHAQVKAALVKDVDALGRTPYQQTIIFAQSATYCSNFVCTVIFPAVPAGYRLVVTHISAQYRLSTGGTLASVAVAVDGSVFGPQLLVATTPIGLSVYVASSPVTFFVEAGHSPSLSLVGQFVLADGSNTAQATVIGYLISLN
jgi:hypothetical protein